MGDSRQERLEQGHVGQVQDGRFLSFDPFLRHLRDRHECLKALDGRTRRIRVVVSLFKKKLKVNNKNKKKQKKTATNIHGEGRNGPIVAIQVVQFTHTNQFGKNAVLCNARR